MRSTENRTSLSRNFFPLVWHFFYLLLWQHWCCFEWPLWFRWLHSDNMNTFSMWSCRTKVDKVHSRALNQNLDISSSCILPVWPIIFHQHTDITPWNKANITGKLRYLSPKKNFWKCLKFIHRLLISNLSKIFHRSGRL